MMNNQNQGKKIPVAQVPDTTKSHQVDKKIEPSTFAPVRNSKTQPIQSLMDADLYEYTGDLLELDGLERQESVDKDSGEVHVASLYTVKIIQKKAKATLGSLLTIKVKNSRSEFSFLAFLCMSGIFSLCFFINSRSVVHRGISNSCRSKSTAITFLVI